jgi:hypothetical protein
MFARVFEPLPFAGAFFERHAELSQIFQARPECRHPTRRLNVQLGEHPLDLCI